MTAGLFFGQLFLRRWALSETLGIRNAWWSDAEGVGETVGVVRSRTCDEDVLSSILTPGSSPVRCYEVNEGDSSSRRRCTSFGDGSAAAHESACTARS